MKLYLKSLLVIGILCVAGSAFADVIVQADYRATGSWLEVVSPGSETAVVADLADITNPPSDVDDNLWCLREDYIAVAGYDAFHSRGPSDDSPEMVVTTSGLAASTEYDVYVRYFVYNNNAAWTSQFGLTSGSLTAFDGNTSGATTLATKPTHASFMLWESLLGTATSTAGGSLAVYFDDNGVNEGSVNGIRLVPEPATLVLLCIGGVAALIKRRRK